MRTPKLFLGRKVKELRNAASLTQSLFAEQISISTSYLNQIENNQRPVSASVLLSLAERFNLNISELSIHEGDRLVTDLREALADPIFEKTQPSIQDLKLIAQNAPAMAHALLASHQAYRRSNEQLAGLDDTIGRTGGAGEPSPYEEIRDYFHYIDNYVDELDRAAEKLASQLPRENTSMLGTLAQHLEDKHNIRLIRRINEDHPDTIRSFDAESKTLCLNPYTPTSTQVFQTAHFIGLREQQSLISDVATRAGFRSNDAIEICKIGLANYYAGALLMPYQEFSQTAKALRHDLELLSNRFQTSIEQTAHRLSTLQRPQQKGIPFFFARIDQAGNITKRHSATKLQFARYGSACPLWNVHQAFETPGKIMHQLAETPDGIRYFCLAMDISKRGGGYKTPVRKYALSLGCEISYANELIYADGIDTSKGSQFEPIGISCRICERQSCHQRATPPMKRALSINQDVREVVPYRFE